MTPAEAGVAALVAVVIAAYLHEYTHVAVFRALGGDAHVKHLALSVQWSMPTRYSVWRDRVGALSPEIVGWVAAVGWVAIAGVPAFAVETLWLWAGWAVYTLQGGLSDYSMAVARGESLLNFPDYWRQLVAGAGCVSVAMFGFVASPEPAIYTVQFFFTHLYIAVYLAGMVLVLLSVRNYSRCTPATA
jgi:hypothetical protein